jgi:hypothetical protein
MSGSLNYRILLIQHKVSQVLGELNKQVGKKREEDRGC